MSRKNFIITALLINLTICITLCIVVFTDKESNGAIEQTKENVVEEENSKVLENDMKDDEVNDSEENSSDEEAYEEEDTSTSKEVGVIIDNETSTLKREEETSKIVESQVQSDTPPVTYIDYNGITLNNQEGTTIDNQEETTTPQETSIVVNGTMATITQSCNIRSQADMNSSSRIGTAILGATYRIEPALCSGNWTAIYLEDNTIGYVSASFCSIS